MILVVYMLVASIALISEVFDAFREQASVRWWGKYARLLGFKALVVVLPRILVGVVAFVVAVGTLFRFTDNIDNALSVGGACLVILIAINFVGVVLAWADEAEFVDKATHRRRGRWGNRKQI